MGKLRTLAFLVLVDILSRSVVSGDYYDITIAYKFNTQYHSDINVDILTPNLNTCEVSVHVQTNAVGPPYIHLEDTTSSQPHIVVYPLTAPTIPALVQPYEQSQWRRLTEHGAAKLETAVYDAHIFDLLEHANVLLDDWVNTKRTISRTEISKINETNVFLHVEVSAKYPKDFEFYLGKTSKDHITVKVYQTNRIKICPNFNQSCQIFVYESNETSKLSIYMNLKGDLKLYDAIARKIFVIETKKTTYHVRYPIKLYREQVTFKIVWIEEHELLNALDDDKNLISPYFYNTNPSSSLFITYYRKIGRNSLGALLCDRDENNIINLESKDLTVTKVPRNETYEKVVGKFDIQYSQDWSQEKYILVLVDKYVFIKEIWEGAELTIYRIHASEPCEKHVITEIYQAALEEPRQTGGVVKCFNGGFIHQSNKYCVCPPGFAGETCKIACGRNHFGKLCTNVCSRTGSDCKGMVLCTPGYGCSCAPGYYGNQCLEQCSEGTYGADCKQTCGQCKSCDKYTGVCVEQ